MLVSSLDNIFADREDLIEGFIDVKLGNFTHFILIVTPFLFIGLKPYFHHVTILMSVVSASTQRVSLLNLNVHVTIPDVLANPE